MHVRNSVPPSSSSAAPSSLEGMFRSHALYGTSPSLSRIKEDTYALTSQINTLIPAFKTFVPPPNSSDNQAVNYLLSFAPHSLFNLSGVIPIYYHGHCYNIPLSIYVTPNYPIQPPLPILTPTQDMLIKERHTNVDKQGVVYLPYLSGWSKAVNPATGQPSSTLVELVTLMSSIFSSDPPLYEKPKANPVPVLSHSLTHPKPIHDAASSAQAAAQTASSSNVSHAIPAPISRNNPPTSASSTSMTSSVASSQAAAMAAAAAAAATQPPASIPHPKPSGTNSSSSPNDDYLLPESIGSPPPASNRAARKEFLTSSVGSALSSLQTATTSSLSSQVESLLTAQVHLESKDKQYQSMIDNSAREIQRLEAHLAALRQKNEELSTFLTKQAPLHPYTNVDRLVSYTDALSKQLAEVVAQDMACEDGIFMIDRGLSTPGQTKPEQISEGMKIIRNLARKQFFYRALAIKIRERQTLHQQQAQQQSASSAAHLFPQYLPLAASNNPNHI